MAWIDLAQDMDLTPNFWKDFKVGQTLTFKLEDDETTFKIMRIDKKGKKFWVKQIRFLTPEEIALEMTKNELRRRDNATT